MILRLKYYLTLAFVAISVVSYAQYDDVLIVRDDQILFKLNRDWEKEKLLDVAKQYSLDSSLVFEALRQKESAVITIGNTAWMVDCINTSEVCISKNIKDLKGSYSIHNNVFIDPGITGMFKSGNGYVKDESVKYGLNKMKEPTILLLANGNTLFTLPENTEAHEVIITGSFNNWSTKGIKMNKVKTGWTAELKLVPGKYLYKFIVDGQWMRDPNNLLKENDGENDFNSVHFVYNHTFSLPDYYDARKVILAMSLNDWNEKELKMTKTASGWQLPIYLQRGTHFYKYIIDGNWITDPQNEAVKPDGMGNFNSVITIGDPTIFSLLGYGNAHDVRLAGSFNNWNPEDLKLTKTTQGWEIPYVLAPGNYEYKFIVDNEWIRDPKNPLVAATNGEVNSYLSVEPNQLFSLQGYPYAKEVIVTGDFTGWSETNFKMNLINGEWIFPVYLDQGKHHYKFIVDGNWILDPTNRLFEMNEFDTGNSILWIGN